MEKVIKCFSIQYNLRTLFNKRAKEDDIEFEVFNGVRVICLSFIILGNTYFFTLKGALQNMNIIQEWMSDFFFSIILSAELIVDIFFWMTAFFGSYFMLSKLKENDGVQGNWAKIYLDRLVRLLPAYVFALFFFWKFLVLFGGEGPMFYMYSSMTECKKYWFWHVTFLNNLIPWSSQDTCLPWTWYLANDFQFFLLLPILSSLYFKNRKWFYITIGSIILVS